MHNAVAPGPPATPISSRIASNTTASASMLDVLAAAKLDDEQFWQDAYHYGVMSLVVAADLVLVFGSAVPFLFQYVEIRRRRSARGFSLVVCATLLAANILRIMFWFGKRFRPALLLQSVVMICVQAALIDLAVDVKRKSLLPPVKDRTLWEGHFISSFWDWTDTSSYLAATCTFAALSAVLTAFMLHNHYYVEALGLVSLMAEANLGTPQAVRNFRRKSVAGMSVSMVVLWLVGDIAKTIYFVAVQAPMQFWLCGGVQISIDLIIVLQVLCYRQKAADL